MQSQLLKHPDFADVDDGEELAFHGHAPAFSSEGEDGDAAGDDPEDGSSGDPDVVDHQGDDAHTARKRGRGEAEDDAATALFRDFDEVFNGVSLAARVSVCRGYQAYLSALVRASKQLEDRPKAKRAYFKSGAFSKKK